MKKLNAKKTIALAGCTLMSLVMIGGDIVCSQPTISHTITAYFGGGINVTDEELKATSYENAAAVSKSIAEEGLVLLKNENNTLPLTGVTAVNLFGYRSAHTYLSGSGSSGVAGGNETTMKDALSQAGIAVNEALYDKYLNYEATTTSDFDVIEPAVTDAEFYSEDLWKEYQNFSDTAVYVIGRKGGEGADLIHGYLSISDEERALLNEIEKRFDKVIVLVNTGNAMELGFLDETEVDAAMLINYTGNNGTEAVAEALTGAINPSGKTIDTYAYDHSTNPTYNAFGVEATRAYTGIDADAITGRGYYYIDYTEGIYVGYKYYETRFVDNETGAVDEAAYRETVQYPFGYGLSYTDFEKKIVAVDGTLGTNNADEITVTVEVTNTGDTAGKEVVEIYATPPYTVGGIEKAQVNLVGFAKTKALAAGESEEVKVSFKVGDLASYDYNDANKNGHTGYELETGDYVISLRDDAHTVVDERTLTMADTAYFDTDAATGNEISSRFAEVAGSEESENIVYLSRADWEGIWNMGDGKADTYIDYSESEGMTAYKIVYSEGRTASEAVKNSTNAYWSEHYADQDDTSAEMPTTEAKNGLTISDLAGVAYDDPKWDLLLDELSITEMQALIGSGSMGIGAVESIELKQTASNDGTAGITAAYGYNGGTSTDSCYAYPNEGAVASTWNTALAYAEGAAVAMEADACNVTTWYAPGANIHRSPYGGRDCDYYSEDALISGSMAASVVDGGQDNAMTVEIKHFAVNEQETARNVDGLYTWVNEQALREIYLKPFEITVKTSGLRAIMSSFNRIGATWTGASHALLTDVLRDEWGYVGMVETDAYVPMPGGDATYYMMMDTGIRAGNDLWLQGFGSDAPSVEVNEAYTTTVMREACHRILYSIADGKHIDSELGIQNWQIALIAVSAAVYALTIFVFYWLLFRKPKKGTVE